MQKWRSSILWFGGGAAALLLPLAIELLSPVYGLGLFLLAVLLFSKKSSSVAASSLCRLPRLAMAQHPLERSQHRRLEGRHYGFTHWSDGCGASSVFAARRYTLEQEMAAGFCLDDADCVDVHLLQELVPQRMGQL